MTRLRTMWWPYVRYDCDGIDGEGECLHRYEDDGWGYSVEFCEHDKPWRILRIHGWTHYSHDGWTHHRCGHCNQDMTEAMDKPRHWKKPRTIFVQSMGDLFHKGVPFWFVHRVFEVIRSCPQHTFMILTKRPERMAEYATAFFRDDNPWPLPNLRLYTSIEDQRTAGERMGWLKKTPAVVHGLSIEPMLAPIELNLDGINHVIVGGESGPGARPMHPDWARSVRDQCAEAGVKFFFKSYGDWIPKLEWPFPLKGEKWGTLDIDGNWFPGATPWNGRQGDDSDTHEYVMIRVGKRAAGRELDGRTWDEMPGQAKEETNG